MKTELPDISDEEFLRIYGLSFTSPNEEVLNERKFIANLLGLPSKKLSPTYTFDQLSNRVSVWKGLNVGIADLEEEISKLFKKAGFKAEAYQQPETIGQLINQILEARARIKG